ncbi:hypothetical protein [Streptomyces justiciae]|uniref:Secreted protein n=1 Tax=Streptomyces justiciae TaxID=2780140 RepID=A0ABU3M7H7_9ACTN|nr:hypothetical protein [Streptomyces justiciae]MDT7846727.1 hypothetical protein [Streptomyces justiciae]
MAASRRRRLTSLATAVAAVTLTASLATGCEFGDTLDCLTNADEITDSITAINEAGADAIDDPTRTEESLETIEKNIDKINAEKDDSGDSEVGDAIDDLTQAIDDYNEAILNGATDPDTSQIDAAADRLKNVCTP